MGCSTNTLRRALARACSPLALTLSLAAAPALAQTASAPVSLDLGAVLSTGTGDAANLVNTPGTAPYEAPSVAPLNSSQPTSVVNKHTMDNLLIPTESYTDAARLTPSVNVIDPNGPGGQESDGPSIRGFQDGQYNLTFDGIPIGDSNDFTHHSTSFFSNNVIDQTIIDRGPGTAETVGDATFGGTMSLRSINPAPEQTLTASGGYGSFNTSVEGLQYDTGAIQSLNGTAAVFAVQHNKTDGALQNAHQERSNFFGKVVIPVSSNTTVTLFSDYNKLYQNPSIGATLDEMGYYGGNYAYNNDPNSQAYWKYNNDEITTDMEYADVESNLGDGLQYDGKIYTYAYYHHDLNGDDPNDQGLPGQVIPGGVPVPNEVQLSPTSAPIAGVPGELFTNSYRSVGTIQRLEKDFAWGDIKTGFWFDHQVNTRSVSEVSLTNGNAYDYAIGTDSNAGAGINKTGITADNENGVIDRLQHNQLYTFQPYLQADYEPIDGLTLTGGVKYAFFKRALNAPVQQTTEVTTGYTHDWGKFLPSFEVKYAFSPNLSTYAQVAEGFLAPNLNTFYTSQIANQSFAPEQTWNYQTGFAYQDQHLAIGGDVYLVHFTNFINKEKNPNPDLSGSANDIFVNSGGAVYKGIEGEVTYTFDFGASLFANAGLNYADLTQGHQYIAQVPKGTANFGVIYDKDGIFASVIDQWTGGEYSGDVPTYAGDNADAGHGDSPGEWYDPYNVVNLAAGYTFNHLAPHLNQVSMKLNVDNITNQKQIIFDNGTNGLGQNLYFRLPGIGVFGTITVPVNF